MKLIKLLSIYVVLSVSFTTSNAVAQTLDKLKPLNAKETTYISQIEKDGRLLYEKDIRAAKATDLLLSKIYPSDYPNFVGWVTYPNAEDFTVSFYQKSGQHFDVIADVTFNSNKQPTIEVDPSRNISATENSMLKARITGLKHGYNSCSNRFNTVVIPSQNTEAWDVYVLAATTNPTLMQVGGHVKLTISKETAEIINKQPLSKSCLALDKSGSNLSQEKRIAALTVSHIVTPMPVAIHPYLNLLHNMPLVVSSERGLWMLESGHIKILK